MAVSLDRRRGYFVFGSESVGGFLLGIILIPTSRVLIFAAMCVLLLPVVPFAPEIAGLVGVKVAAGKVRY